MESALEEARRRPVAQQHLWLDDEGSARLAHAHNCMPPSVIDKIKEGTAMGIIDMPDALANAVVFLCSEDSRFITAQSLLIDGGRWMI